MWDGGWGWGSWTLLTFVVVLFSASVTVLVIAAIRYLADRRGTAASGPVSWQKQPEDLLNERLARGEIDDDDYRQHLALLREHR